MLNRLWIWFLTGVVWLVARRTKRDVLYTRDHLEGAELIDAQGASLIYVRDGEFIYVPAKSPDEPEA